MQQVIDKLIAQLGKNETEMIINGSISALRYNGRIDLVDYVYAQIGALLDSDERKTFINSIVNLDSAIVSVNL